MNNILELSNKIESTVDISNKMKMINELNSLIEKENLIEQQGGYQTIKNTSLKLHDSKYTCTFLEKQLFLLHLNCLTKVYLYENKNLDNFYIYYDDHHEGYGYYQEILKNMFKQLTWTNNHDKSKQCIFFSDDLDIDFFLNIFSFIFKINFCNLEGSFLNS
jgi:hypothetical protein